LVAALEAVELAVLLVAERLDPRAILADDLARLLSLVGAAEVERLQAEPLALVGQDLGALVAAQGLARGRAEDRPADGLLQRLDHLLVLVGDLDALGRLGVLQLLLGGLPL